MNYLLPLLSVLLGYGIAIGLRPKAKQNLKLLLAFSGSFLLSLTVIHLLPEVYENHNHKMDYARYAANGWQIGSGQVESACNTVINARLAGSGRRWRILGSDGVCHLRALCKSDLSQWQQYWHPQSP